MSIPTIVISGYLGAGKTSLILDFLADPQDLRAVVLAGDLARTNLNADLISETGTEVIALSDDTLETAAAEAVARAPDVVLIETSALARPADIAAGLRAVDGLAPALIVTAVHLEAIGPTLQDARVGPLARSQIEDAHALALNRGDAGDLPMREDAPRVQTLHQVLKSTAKAAERRPTAQTPPAFDQAVVKPDPMPLNAFIGWLQKLRPAPHRAKGPVRLYDDEDNLTTVWVNLAQGDLTLTPRPDLGDTDPHLILIAPKAG